MPIEEKDQLFKINDTLSDSFEKDRYRIVEFLGRPDKSYSYKAFDSILGRCVTIRAMRPDEPLSDKSKENFLLRAGYLKHCGHQTILNVQGYGIFDSGIIYLVSEYVEGYTLADLLKVQNKLSIEEALPIFRDLCDALAETYKQSTIHGAICPENIFLHTDRRLTIDYKEGRETHRIRRAAKLGNFRISHFARPRANEKTHMKFGMTFSDPTYMSPEQCKGLPITHSSDIYSLGCVMYRVLSGISTVSNKTDTEALYAQVNESPMPISALVESLPFHLETMIMTAIQKVPRDRYHSAYQMLDSLDLVDDTTGIKHRLADKPFQRSLYNTFFLLIKYLFGERAFVEWGSNKIRANNLSKTNKLLNLDKPKSIKGLSIN